MDIKQVLILICLYSYIVKWKYPPGDVLWYEKLHNKARVINGLFLYFGTSLMAFENYVFLQEICHRALVAVGCSMAVAAAVPTAKKLTSQQGWNWKSLVTVGILCIDRAQWLHWLNWQWGCVIGSQMAAQKHDDDLFFFATYNYTILNTVWKTKSVIFGSFIAVFRAPAITGWISM